MRVFVRQSINDGVLPQAARVFRRLRRAGRCVVLVLIPLVSLFFGNATSLEARQRYPLIVSGGTHSLTVPWHTGPVTDRLNPAFVVGTERTLRPEGRVRLYQTANVGFFHHYWWMNGVFINTELGVGRTLPLGLYSDVRLGVGYLHYFWRRKTLELKDGEYVQATNWGRPSIMVPLSVVLAYRGSPDRPLTVAPFISAQWAAQGLFLDEIPAMTHFFILVGVRIDRGAAVSSLGS